MVEAKKLAYSDLEAQNADPKFAKVPVSNLLSKSYAATLCGRINADKASKPAVTGGQTGGTIYLTTADRWGNMVSLIHSVFSVYGSRATVAPYGFVLHNRGSAFSLDPRSPNIVAPHKRPFHTIIAGFVMKDGQPLMTFGNMGGSVQPETHAQHMVNVIDLGMNVQMTTDAARFTHNQTSNVLSLETNLFNLVGAALKAKGHEVRSVTGGSVGGYQGILFTRDPACPSRYSIVGQPPTICRSMACTVAARIIGKMVRPSAGRKCSQASSRFVPRGGQPSFRGRTSAGLVSQVANERHDDEDCRPYGRPDQNRERYHRTGRKLEEVAEFSWLITNCQWKVSGIDHGCRTRNVLQSLASFCSTFLISGAVLARRRAFRSARFAARSALT